MNVRAYTAELVKAQLEGRIPADLPENITISELVDISARNHMDYLLLGALLRVKNITEEEKNLFRGRVMASIMRTMAQVADIQQLEKKFEEKGIRNQPMKGSRLKFIYPSPEMREMSDVDILIDEGQMDQASEVLVEMGYTMSQAIKHHDIYIKKPFMCVEAHRAMYDKSVDGGQFKYFASFGKAVLREGFQYTYDFKTEDFYVYMMAHMAKHFYKMGCGIRNLVDVYMYLTKYGNTMDRNYLDKELEVCGILGFTKHMETLAMVWLNGEECNEFYEELFQYMQDSGIYGKDENGIWNKFAEEKNKDQDVDINKLKNWYFFPPIAYMAEYYPWLEEHPYLLPVAWGIRAFRGLFLKKGVHKRQMLHEIDQDTVKTYQRIYQEMGLHFKR